MAQGVTLVHGRDVPKSQVWGGIRSEAAVGSICLAGALLRILPLSRESMWYDEVTTVRHLGAPTFSAYLNAVHVTNWDVPPLFFALQYGWAQVFGPSEIASRSLSITFGVAAIFLTYLVVCRLFGSLAGVLGAAWVAFSPSHVYYATEVRMYSVVLAAVLLSLLSLMIVNDGGRRAWWGVHAAANAAAIWLQPTTGAVFAVFGLFVLWRWRKDWRVIAVWTAGHVAITGSVLCWMLTVDRTLMADGFEWIPRPSIFAVKDTIRRWFGMMPLDPMNNRLTPARYAFLTGAASWIALLLVPAILYLGWESYRARRSDDAPWRAFGFTGLWMIVPGAVLVLLSWIWMPCYVPRYFLYSSVAAYAMIGGATAAAPVGFARFSAVAIQCLVFVWFTVATMANPARPDWRGVAAYIDGHEVEGSALVTPERGLPVLYYAGDGKAWEEPCLDYTCIESRTLAGHADDRQVWVILEGRRLRYAPALTSALDAAGIAFEKIAIGNILLFRIDGSA